MKKIITTVMVLTVMFSSCTMDMHPEGTTPESILEESCITEINPALKIAPKNRKIADKYGLLNWYEIKFDESYSPQEIASRIASRTSVRTIQYKSELKRINSDINIEADLGMMTRSSSELPFNDPMLGSQQRITLHDTLNRSRQWRRKNSAFFQRRKGYIPGRRDIRS